MEVTGAPRLRCWFRFLVILVASHTVVIGQSWNSPPVSSRFRPQSWSSNSSPVRNSRSLGTGRSQFRQQTWSRGTGLQTNPVGTSQRVLPLVTNNANQWANQQPQSRSVTSVRGNNINLVGQRTIRITPSTSRRWGPSVNADTFGRSVQQEHRGVGKSTNSGGLPATLHQQRQFSLNNIQRSVNTRQPVQSNSATQHNFNTLSNVRQQSHTDFTQFQPSSPQSLQNSNTNTLISGRQQVPQQAAALQQAMPAAASQFDVPTATQPDQIHTHFQTMQAQNHFQPNPMMVMGAQNHVASIYGQPIPPFQHFGSAIGLPAIGPMSFGSGLSYGIPAHMPWMHMPMHPDMMQEMMFGDTIDPPDPADPPAGTTSKEKNVLPQLQAPVHDQMPATAASASGSPVPTDVPVSGPSKTPTLAVDPSVPAVDVSPQVKTSSDLSSQLALLMPQLQQMLSRHLADQQKPKEPKQPTAADLGVDLSKVSSLEPTKGHVEPSLAQTIDPEVKKVRIESEIVGKPVLTTTINEEPALKVEPTFTSENTPTTTPPTASGDLLSDLHSPLFLNVIQELVKKVLMQMNPTTTTIMPPTTTDDL